MFAKEKFMQTMPTHAAIRPKVKTCQQQACPVSYSVTNGPLF
jgi:hypothetical protein